MGFSEQFKFRFKKRKAPLFEDPEAEDMFWDIVKEDYGNTKKKYVKRYLRDNKLEARGGWDEEERKYRYWIIQRGNEDYRWFEGEVMTRNKRYAVRMITNGIIISANHWYLTRPTLVRLHCQAGSY